MAPTVSLIFVRHMETTREGDNPPLSEKGRQQLQDLLTALRQFPISYVYSSDLWRAVEPAEAIAKMFRVPHQVSTALREIRSSSEFPRPRRSQSSPAADGNESAKDTAAFEDRVAKAIDAIAARHNGSHVVLVTHSGTIRAAMRYLLALPLPVFGLSSVAPGSMIILTRDSSGAWRSRT